MEKTRTHKTIITLLLTVIIFAGMFTNHVVSNEMTEITTEVPLAGPVKSYSYDVRTAKIRIPVRSLQAMPKASQMETNRVTNEYGTINWSEAPFGKITVTYTAPTAKRIKCIVSTNNKRYIYDITPGESTELSLSEGNGTYKVALMENTHDIRYITRVSAQFDARLNNELYPFLTSNQYVNWKNSPYITARASRLTQGAKTDGEKVDKIYDYIVQNITYDKYKAETVQPGYVPNLEHILSAKKDICFDYAALMAGMLRSQGVPCKLVTGYTNNAYHAWVSIYTYESGWTRMDPTFAATSNNNPEILKFIGNGQNYRPTEYY